MNKQNMKKRTFEGSEIAGSKKQKVLGKGQVWMWLFEIFEEYDGRGANGDAASIEVLIKDKKKVKKAATYGWIDIEEDELHLEPEVESMEMQVLTEDFYLDLECVTDEEFLKMERRVERIERNIRRFRGRRVRGRRVRGR